jgi:hypothetical protein
MSSCKKTPVSGSQYEQRELVSVRVALANSNRSRVALGSQIIVALTIVETHWYWSSGQDCSGATTSALYWLEALKSFGRQAHEYL